MSAPRVRQDQKDRIRRRCLGLVEVVLAETQGQLAKAVVQYVGTFPKAEYESHIPRTRTGAVSHQKGAGPYSFPRGLGETDVSLGHLGGLPSSVATALMALGVVHTWSGRLKNALRFHPVPGSVPLLTGTQYVLQCTVDNVPYYRHLKYGTSQMVGRDFGQGLSQAALLPLTVALADVGIHVTGV